MYKAVIVSGRREPRVLPPPPAPDTQPSLSPPALIARPPPPFLPLSLVGREFYQQIEHTSTTRELAPSTVVLSTVSFAVSRGDLQLTAALEVAGP